MRSWAGFVGIVILLSLVVVATPLWMKLATDNEKLANAVAGGLGLILAIAVLAVYWRQANIVERQENLQRAWLIAGMGDVHHNEVDATGAQITGPNKRPVVFCNPNYHNYGQTPAFVSYLDYGFCSDPPPAKPNWRACKQFPINNWTSTSKIPSP